MIYRGDHHPYHRARRAASPGCRYDNAARGNCFDTARCTSSSTRWRPPPPTRHHAVIRLEMAGKHFCGGWDTASFAAWPTDHPGGGRRRAARQRRARYTASGGCPCPRGRAVRGPGHRVRRRPAQRRAPAGGRRRDARLSPARGPVRLRAGRRRPHDHPGDAAPQAYALLTGAATATAANCSPGAWSPGSSPTTTWTRAVDELVEACWRCRAAHPARGRRGGRVEPVHRHRRPRVRQSRPARSSAPAEAAARQRQHRSDRNRRFRPVRRSGWSCAPPGPEAGRGVLQRAARLDRCGTSGSARSRTGCAASTDATSPGSPTPRPCTAGGPAAGSPTSPSTRDRRCRAPGGRPRRGVGHAAAAPAGGRDRRHGDRPVRRGLRPLPG